MFCTSEASCIVTHNVKSICVLWLDPSTGRRSDLFFESCQTPNEACFLDIRFMIVFDNELGIVFSFLMFDVRGTYLEKSLF